MITIPYYLKWFCALVDSEEKENPNMLVPPAMLIWIRIFDVGDPSYS